MGFLERAIRKGIKKGIGDAISQTIQPKANEIINKATEEIENVTRQAQQQSRQHQKSPLDNAFANLESATLNYATEASKNVKVCPSCQQSTSADKKFCPNCGSKLPEQTLAQSCVCTTCGKQNNVGTRFCQECGSKLPYALEEERQAYQRDQEVLKMWNECLSNYPIWGCGGKDLFLEPCGDGYRFNANFEGSYTEARKAIESYRSVLSENGFVHAGQYKSEKHFYKMVEGKCYHVDLEHCFESSSDTPEIYFDINEPYGGFYYKKEEKKVKGLKDLFKF